MTVSRSRNIGCRAVAAGVERWARALSRIPTPVFEIPDQAVVLPMRRSFLGTPVVTIKINGKTLDLGTLTSPNALLDAVKAAGQ